jgi:hypothetical protein
MRGAQLRRRSIHVLLVMASRRQRWGEASLQQLPSPVSEVLQNASFEVGNLVDELRDLIWKLWRI